MAAQSKNENGNGWNEWSRHVLKELERLNDNIEGTRSEIIEMKEDIIKVKGMHFSLDELKEWKKEMDETISPTQLKDLTAEIASLKTFKTVSTTAWIIVQLIMAGLLTFRDQIFG